MTQRDRCKAFYQQAQRDAMLRQGDPVENLLAFVQAELYFGNEPDRAEFKAMVAEVKPNWMMKENAMTQPSREELLALASKLPRNVSSAARELASEIMSDMADEPHDGGAYLLAQWIDALHGVAQEPIILDDELAGWARSWHWNDCAEDKPVDPSIYFRDMRMLKAFIEKGRARLAAPPASSGEVREATIEECAKVAHDRRQVHNNNISSANRHVNALIAREAGIIEQQIRALKSPSVAQPVADPVGEGLRDLQSQSAMETDRFGSAKPPRPVKS